MENLEEKQRLWWNQLRWTPKLRQLAKVEPLPLESADGRRSRT
jgi:hypothetical protein